MVWYLWNNWYGSKVLHEIQWTKETHDHVFLPAKREAEGQLKMRVSNAKKLQNQKIFICSNTFYNFIWNGLLSKFCVH